MSEHDPELYERLAAIQHDIWSHWMRYLLDIKARACECEPGAWLAPGDVAHWRSQIERPYAELSEREKASDREQVDRFWHLVDGSPVVRLADRLLTEAAEAAVEVAGLPQTTENVDVHRHMRNERKLKLAIADEMYRALGLPVPPTVEAVQ